jgi:deoxyribodipyrimidine photolyase
MVVKKEEEFEKRALVWFRKGLRLHDNPALMEASKSATALYPVFILDPAWLKPEEIGANRTQFLLDSLVDLDKSLQKLGSSLLCFRGKPEEILPSLMKVSDAPTPFFCVLFLETSSMVYSPSTSLSLSIDRNWISIT